MIVSTFDDDPIAFELTDIQAGNQQDEQRFHDTLLKALKDNNVTEAAQSFFLGIDPDQEDPDIVAPKTLREFCSKEFWDRYTAKFSDQMDEDDPFYYRKVTMNTFIKDLIKLMRTED